MSGGSKTIVKILKSTLLDLVVLQDSEPAEFIVMTEVVTMIESAKSVMLDILLEQNLAKIYKL